MTRALVLSGGGRSGTRWPWPNERGHTRHMIPFHGEPLIHRTTRQLAERGVTDIRVLADADCGDYVTAPAVWDIPRPVARSWVQEWEPSRHLWAERGRTMILYGDCYFSDPLMDAMCSDSGDPWQVYARFGASERTGKPYGEMFGWCFTAEHATTLTAAQQESIRFKQMGRTGRALGWEVYRIAVGIPPNEHRTSTNFVDWDDTSDDFDTTRDLDAWAALNPDLL